MNNSKPHPSEESMSHAFVDESKAKDYFLMAALIHHGDLQRIRLALKSLCLKNQTYFHMTKERDSQRKKILTKIVELGISVHIYRATTDNRSQIEARKACLHALLSDLLSYRVGNLCLEQDETMDGRDRRVISEFLGSHQARERLTYDHRKASSEILLSIPDAVGWAWAIGGHWRKMVETIVTEIDV